MSPGKSLSGTETGERPGVATGVAGPARGLQLLTKCPGARVSRELRERYLTEPLRCECLHGSRSPQVCERHASLSYLGRSMRSVKNISLLIFCSCSVVKIKGGKSEVGEGGDGCGVQMSLTQ